LINKDLTLFIRQGKKIKFLLIL